MIPGRLLLGLGIVSVTACGLAPGPQEGQAPADGEAVESTSHPLYVLTTALWPGGVVPVCWSNPGHELERTWVRNVIARTWEAAAQVTFTGWGPCPDNFSGVRIDWSDEGPFTQGLGTNLRGTLGMILNPDFMLVDAPETCAAPESRRQFCIEMFAVHEFGHALGFAHEQNRPDTPSTCTKPKQGADGNAPYGNWDLMSVMNYCNPALNGNGQLSPTDIAGAAAYYGGPICWGNSSWSGCRGTGCTTCAEKTGAYPLYRYNHPKCGISNTCGNSFYACSTNCPAPTAADLCDGTPGQWAGCRGSGCTVCQEKLAQYPNYARRHPMCTVSTSCANRFFTCNANCPAPTDLDR